jgi:hypothetical protein
MNSVARSNYEFKIKAYVIIPLLRGLPAAGFRAGVCLKAIRFQRSEDHCELRIKRKKQKIKKIKKPPSLYGEGQGERS